MGQSHVNVQVTFVLEVCFACFYSRCKSISHWKISKRFFHLINLQNGYITSAVYIALSFSLTGFGFFSDWIGQKKLLSDTLSRKIFETIALVGPAICLIVIPQLGCNLAGLVALLIVAMIIFGFNAGGDKIIVVDIAPDHSGTIYGITNAIASLPGILSPLVVGFLINLVRHLHCTICILNYLILPPTETWHRRLEHCFLLSSWRLYFWNG